MAPTISVILPSRDRPIEVRRAAATVIAQTFTDWELVIVDDGSDPAADVVGLEALDPRITVLRNDVATGVSRARNRGIAAAQAPWLAFLDDDDYELALLHTNVVRAPSSVMVRAAAMAETDGFDPELSVVADWDMWLRLNEHVRATAVPEPLTGVIEHPDSMQLQLADQIGDELRHLHARHDSRARERGWRFGSPAVAHWHSQKLWAIHRTPWRGAVYGWNVLRCNGLRGTVGKLSEHRSWQRAEAPDWVRTQLESPVVAPVSGRHGLTGARTPQSRAL